SPDRHKAKHVGNLVFRSDLTYDPEGLGAGARH
ncbi:hypothetical protein SAMN05216565_1161, partial [Litchfieldia salsa]